MIRLSPLALLLLLLATTGCTVPGDALDPESQAEAFRRHGAYWETIPVVQREPAYWETIPIMVGVALDQNQCAPDATTCTEPAYWETIPLVLEIGMREHTGDDLLYLRHEPTILDIVSRMESRYPELSGARDLAGDPVKWNELEMVTSVGVDACDMADPGFRGSPILNMADLEDVFFEGLECLSTQP